MNFKFNILFFRQYKTFLSVLIITFLFASNIQSQVKDSVPVKNNEIVLKNQFFQIKDNFNYGLVHTGLTLKMAYQHEVEIQNNFLSYRPELGFGANYRKGIGLIWQLKPIDFFYGNKITNNYGHFICGLYGTTNYNWQLYPELQSGHMFWNTSFEVGPQIIVKKRIKNKLLNIRFSNSLIGWISRPEPSTEEYYYALAISDFISNAHSNLKFGSLNMFNHTNIEVKMNNENKKKLSFSFELDYWGYYPKPKLSMLSYSFNLNWKIRKS